MPWEELFTSAGCRFVRRRARQEGPDTAPARNRWRRVFHRNPILARVTPPSGVAHLSLIQVDELVVGAGALG